MRHRWQTGWRRFYGAGPLHLTGHLAALAIVGFALAQMVAGSDIAALIIMLVAFLVGHDLVLVPTYSGLDRLSRRAIERLPHRRMNRVPVINHIRAPVLIS